MFIGRYVIEVASLVGYSEQNHALKAGESRPLSLTVAYEDGQPYTVTGREIAALNPHFVYSVDGVAEATSEGELKGLAPGWTILTVVLPKAGLVVEANVVVISSAEIVSMRFASENYSVVQGARKSILAFGALVRRVDLQPKCPYAEEWSYV